jgi:NADPH:quinone reductase
VLITGASGGVGDFGVQLARQTGAQVVALVRAEARAERIRQLGAQVVAVGETAAAAAAYGPYHLVFDGIGGDVLASALPLLAPDGMAVAYGRTVGTSITFDLGQFFGKGGLSLYGFILFHEVRRESAGFGLARLVAMVAAKQLHPYITVETSWSDISEVARQLLEREYPGKAVLLIE